MLHGTRRGDKRVARGFVCSFKALAKNESRPDLTARKTTCCKSQGKARVTNGSSFLGAGADGRSVWARRARDVFNEHLSDLGGEDNTSAAERSIIRRVAILTVELERLETKFAAAGEAGERDLDLYQRSAGNMRRLLESVGLQRRQRDVTPDPLQFARSYQNGDGA
jgi:hypothetical protein